MEESSMDPEYAAAQGQSASMEFTTSASVLPAPAAPIVPRKVSDEEVAEVGHGKQPFRNLQ